MSDNNKCRFIPRIDQDYIYDESDNIEFIEGINNVYGNDGKFICYELRCITDNGSGIEFPELEVEYKYNDKNIEIVSITYDEWYELSTEIETEIYNLINFRIQKDIIKGSI